MEALMILCKTAAGKAHNALHGSKMQVSHALADSLSAIIDFALFLEVKSILVRYLVFRRRRLANLIVTQRNQGPIL